jgi:hypothetical protein
MTKLGSDLRSEAATSNTALQDAQKSAKHSTDLEINNLKHEIRKVSDFAKKTLPAAVGFVGGVVGICAAIFFGIQKESIHQQIDAKVASAVDEQITHGAASKAADSAGTERDRAKAAADNAERVVSAAQRTLADVQSGQRALAALLDPASGIIARLDGIKSGQLHVKQLPVSVGPTRQYPAHGFWPVTTAGLGEQIFRSESNMQVGIDAASPLSSTFGREVIACWAVPTAQLHEETPVAVPLPHPQMARLEAVKTQANKVVLITSSYGGPAGSTVPGIPVSIFVLFVE